MTAARATVQRLIASDWSHDQERDALLAELIGKPLSPADALQLATHADDQVAVAGQRFFGARATARAVHGVLEKLKQQGGPERQRLMEAVRAVPSELVRPAIDELLRSRDPGERRLGWDTAVELSDPLRNFYLQKAVIAAPPAMRLKALGMMLESRKAEEIEALLIKLADAEDSRLANRALQALAEVEGEAVLKLMLSRFAGEETQARAIAREYLKREAKTSPELVRKAMLHGLTHRDRQVRKAAAQVLFASGAPEEVVPEALQFCSGLLGWLRTRVIEGLSEGGEAVLAATITLLGHEDAGTRFYALTLAEAFDSPELVQPMCKLLHDEDWWIQVTVCDALARLGDERAVPELIAVLDDDEIRWAAIDALGRLATPAALQALVERLKDPRDEVRLEVLQGLARVQDERLMPVFTHCRNTDGSLTVRRRASELITRLINDLGLDVELPEELQEERTFERPLDQRLYEARRMGASDVNLSVGESPMMRLDGELKAMTDAPLGPKETKEQILSVLGEEESRTMLQNGQLDFSYELDGVGRHRGSAFLQRKGWSASYRVIPDRPPTMEELGMPEPLYDLDTYHQGIVVFCGPTGSGKSSSLAAVVDRLNNRKPVHIITMEDPIELVHRSKLALVNQREVGVHTRSYADGLRAALREDPDVLVIGELREPRAIRLAMEAAETGHLVLTTLHTSNVVQAIDRLVTAFSPEEQAHARSALSESLKFVVCQRLVQKAKPPGRTGVFELLKVTPSIGHLIRKAESHQIPGMMQLGSEIGNQTLDQALLKRVQQREIRPEDAWYLASKRSVFEPMCDPAWLADRGVTAR